MHECLGHGSGRLLPEVDADALKAYGATIEEARADLFGLYYMADSKMVELGLLPDGEAYKAQYYHYYTDHLLYSLGQIAERFRGSNNPNSSNDYFVRRSANRNNYGFDKNNYPILSNKAFRNTIEHIDEHNIEVIKKHDVVGGFNTIDEETPQELKDTLRNKRDTQTYTLDLLLKQLYIERNETPLTMRLDDLKKEILDLKKKVDDFWGF